MRPVAVGLLVLGLLASVAGGCDAATEQESYRPIVVEAGPVSALRLGILWQQIAESGDFDPENATFESLWLEYSGSGTLLRLSIGAFTGQGQLVQVGFTGGEAPESKAVTVSGGVASARRTPLGVTTAPAALCQAVDLVGPISMIDLLAPAGPNGRYALTFAPLKGDTSGPIPASATVYCWDGSAFASLSPTDERREYDARYAYLAGFSATAVSSSPAGTGTATSEYQSSGEAVYFLIPRPAI
jgi:hypothetical protein